MNKFGKERKNLFIFLVTMCVKVDWNCVGNAKKEVGVRRTHRSPPSESVNFIERGKFSFPISVIQVPGGGQEAWQEDE